MELLWESRLELLDALFVTVRLTVLSFALSVLPALLIALARTYGPAPVRTALTGLIILIRGVPSLLLVFIAFFALPYLGIVVSSFFSVAVTLAVVQTVYVSEVFRSALAAVEKGQFEAAQSLGLGPVEAFTRIIVPQAAVVAAPAFISSCVQLVQNTTIASSVALYDLLGRARSIAVNTLDGSPILAVAVVYVLLLVPLVRVGRRMERRLLLTHMEA